MSERIPQKKTLDLGGGVGDFDLELSRKNRKRGLITEGEWQQQLDLARGYVNNLRAVKEALEHPDEEFFVLDPNAPREICLEVTNEVPNVRFVVSRVELNDSIPYPSNHFDSAEMNFIFTPFTSEQNIAADKAGDPEWYKKPINKAEDVPLYAHTLVEAARVLKKGGRMIISEKQQRMQRIFGLLSTQDDDSTLEHGSDFLRKTLTMRFVSYNEITDPSYTGYADSAIFLANDENMVSRRSQEFMDSQRPFRLDLEKVQ